MRCNESASLDLRRRLLRDRIAPTNPYMQRVMPGFDQIADEDDVGG